MLPMLAQASFGYTLIHWIIVAVVVAGVIGILFVVLRQAGITVPPFVVTILWIVACVVLAVLAIKFIAALI